MKIPKKIVITGVEYEIENMTDKFENSDNMGRSWVKTCKIKLDLSLKKDRIEKTFFHELIHMILDEGCYVDESRNEKFVEYIAGTIYCVLKENKLIK